MCTSNSATAKVKVQCCEVLTITRGRSLRAMPMELMSLRPYLLTYRYGGRVNSYMFYSHAAPPRWLYISKRGDVVSIHAHGAGLPTTVARLFAWSCCCGSSEYSIVSMSPKKQAPGNQDGLAIARLAIVAMSSWRSCAMVLGIACHVARWQSLRAYLEHRYLLPRFVVPAP